MTVDLRCPECFAWMQERCSRSEMAELDQRQAASRAEIVEAYGRWDAVQQAAVATGTQRDDVARSRSTRR